MDLDLDLEHVVVECAHSILATEKQLIHASGGVLTIPDSDIDVAVICGGEFAQQTSEQSHKKCIILSDEQVTIKDGSSFSLGDFLNEDRIDAAALAIDNGSTLWVTGGFFFQPDATETSQITTELVTIRDNGIPSNAFWLEMPEFLFHHCLVKVGPDVAMIIGGREEYMDTDGHAG